MDEGKEEENNNEAGSSWWGSWPGWLQSAKEKSSTALEFMKRDITEFTQVVQTDAVAAVSSTAAIIKEKLTIDTAEAVADKARQSLTSVLGSITDAFVPQKQLEEGAEPMIIKNSEPVSMDWWESQLHMIQKDPKTFCHEPEGPPEMYENWLESFNIDGYRDEMTNIIMTSSDVREFYNKLVPSSLSHFEFWQRYFYRIYLLHKTEAKRAELIRKAETISIQDIDWDKDEILTGAHSGKKNSGIRQVTAEINIQNRLASNSESASMGALAIPDVNIKKTESNSEKLDEGHVPNSPAKVSDNVSNNETECSSEVLVDSNNGSRSSPVESLGKDYSTGDEWEKDFEAEINELKSQFNTTQAEFLKDEDDWEKCQ